MGTDRSDDATLNFDVIAYRGDLVASRNGWIADEKKRGGVITQVPGGFFHGIMAARYGTAPPFAYELPPIWLLIVDGIDTATLEFLDWANYQGVAEAAENQRQGLVDLVTGAGKAAGDLAAGLPSLVKWSAIGLVAVVGLAALQLLPRSNPRRSSSRRR